jgi:hypothetical protein
MQRKKYGGEGEEAIEENLTNYSYAIMDAINGTTGRWIKCCYVIEQGICMMMLSANNNQINQRVMNNFSQNLRSKTLQINRDVASRVRRPVPIGDLEVRDVTIEEARMMSQNPRFNTFPGFDLEEFEEEMDDWDSGIHKIIAFKSARVI